MDDGDALGGADRGRVGATGLGSARDGRFGVPPHVALPDQELSMRTSAVRMAATTRRPRVPVVGGLGPQRDRSPQAISSTQAVAPTCRGPPDQVWRDEGGGRGQWEQAGPPREGDPAMPA